jgi:hypothetical protein
MSIVGMWADVVIASRYALTGASAAARVSGLANPLLRAAMVKLAAIRFTSYSNGPGSVSSKSFRSNSSRRSGGERAEVRQVGVAAQLGPLRGARSLLGL